MKQLLIVVIIGLVISGCTSETENTDQPQVMQNDPLAIDTVETVSGKFVSYAHNLQGSASLLLKEDHSAILRFENFTLLAGPDVHVLLSKSNNYSSSNVIEIASLKTGYTSSNLNFPLDGVNYTDDYKFVLVYCVEFNSLFGYTELK
ncbi:MAG: DM13 domain-containing protein [Chryseolinea sp.]